MNKKHLIILACLILLNSCIVKSLQPFYTNETVVKNDKISGTWNDQNGGLWKIISFEDEFEKNLESNEKLSDEDKEIKEKFKDSYFVNYTDKKKRDADFFIFLFELDKNLYADFIPFFTNSNDLNELEENHLTPTHSVAKVNFSKENKITFSWFREDKLSKLIQNKRVRIKYLKNEVSGDVLLLDTSENLQEFIKRYEASNIEDKWTQKEAYKLTKKVDAED